MKKELIIKKNLEPDKTKIIVFYYKSDGKRTGVVGLFKELTEDTISVVNKCQIVAFKIDEIVGVQVLEPRNAKEV